MGVLKNNFPKAAAATKNFYVDDYIGGAESDEEALELYKQLSGMFSTCGMSLRKWSSNSEKLLENIPPENRELASSKMFDSEATVKTLGLIWNPTSDKFHFNELKIEENVTKRSMLTTIARVFDPLGSIAPVTIQGKVLVQKAFEERVNWDDEVSGELKEEWLRYKSELTNLPAINFPRYVGVKPAVEIIGYCDASEKAYGACVYVLSEDSNGKPNMHLLCAKTRVAPSKNRQTIPRLELMGAVLLAELMEKVMTAVSIPVSKAKCYTDSMIVLHYLRSNDPARWKTFVANRVALINEIIPHSKWAHVRSASNPADCLSRGCS
uniref:Uncharacterized protein n=1 Tax=Phlebotomus papatasi TaxID=29031 RepID=A0A1B0DHX3_PHLPP